MSNIDATKNKLLRMGRATNFLIDSSAFIFIEDLSQKIERDIFQEIDSSNSLQFFITNDVAVELWQNRDDKYMDPFLKHMINSEISAQRGVKLDRFAVEQNGEIVAAKINNISIPDYGQIVLCQNHPELSLVSNDRKLIKSTFLVLGERVMNPIQMINKFLEVSDDAVLKTSLQDILKDIPMRNIL